MAYSSRVHELLNKFDSLICPITYALFEDPVITVADGHTYEKVAIIEWLKHHNTSPRTGLALSSKELVPNYAIQSLISELARNNGAVFESDDISGKCPLANGKSSLLDGLSTSDWLLNIGIPQQDVPSITESLNSIGGIDYLATISSFDRSELENVMNCCEPAIESDDIDAILNGLELFVSFSDTEPFTPNDVTHSHRDSSSYTAKQKKPDMDQSERLELAITRLEVLASKIAHVSAQPLTRPAVSKVITSTAPTCASSSATASSTSATASALTINRSQGIDPFLSLFSPEIVSTSPRDRIRPYLSRRATAPHNAFLNQKVSSVKSSPFNGCSNGVGNPTTFGSPCISACVTSESASSPSNRVAPWSASSRSPFWLQSPDGSIDKGIASDVEYEGASTNEIVFKGCTRSIRSRRLSRRKPCVVTRTLQGNTDIHGPDNETSCKAFSPFIPMVKWMDCQSSAQENTSVKQVGMPRRKFRSSKVVQDSTPPFPHNGM